MLKLVLLRVAIVDCFIPRFADLLNSAKALVVQVAKDLLHHGRHSYGKDGRFERVLLFTVFIGIEKK